MKTKNYLKLVFLTLLSIGTGLLSAQKNIAVNTNCTFTGTGGNALYGAVRMNDGQINPCGFQDCWFTGGTGGTSTANWILATFNGNEDVNSIRIWVAEKNTRYLSGATIQIWDGSTYVDHYTYNNPYNSGSTFDNPCDYIIRFPRVNTSRIRITKWFVNGGQQSNPDFREMEIYNLKGHDAGFTTILPLFKAGNQTVSGNLRNIGRNRIDSVNVGWSVNGTAQTGFKFRDTLNKMYFKDTLKGFRDTLLSIGSFNFVANSNYVVKVWSSLPNNMVDSILTNDTATFSFTAVGKPAAPIVESKVYCGVSAPLLKGKGAPGTQLNWYEDALGFKFIATGDSVQLKTLKYPIDTIPYYGRSSVTLKLNHKMAPMAGIWSFTGGASPQDKGFYVNIMPKYDILLDSLDIGFTAPNTGTAGPHSIQVYYRQGLHNSFETNSASWTLAATSTVTTSITPLYNNRITPVRVSAGRVILKANTQYALYVQALNVDQSFRANCGAGSAQSNQTRFENEVLIVDEGALGAGTFGNQGVANGYIPEIYYYYELFLESDSAIAKMYIHPKPTGAALLRAANSQGTHRAGIESNFDYVTNGEKIDYALAPPTGYTNANFGTKWAITDFTIRTKTGTNINMLDTVSNLPSTLDSERLSITPRLSEVDSIFKITIKLVDLGPYNCDSIIERWVYVAPTPFADFGFNTTLCDGDNVLFNNLSTIKSGIMTHKWYFRNDSNVIIDSSTSINPIYKFPTYGNYNITLIAKNNQYGYTDDTTIQITIGEIPLIKIKALNACEGIPVTFQNSTTVSTSTPTYLWNFGDGSPTSIATSPMHLYALPGGYQVKLVATAGGCSSEKVINAYQFARPISKFTIPSGLACSNKPIKFTNQSTIPIGVAGSFWKFNDGNAVSTDQNPTHKFSTNGTYPIKLKSVSEFGCEDSVTKSFVVNLGPKASFTSDKSCERENTQFTNTSTDKGTGYSTYWSFGDGTTAFAESPSHTWATIGKKEVVFAITSSSSCTDTLKRVLDILPQPIASFTAPVTCSGNDVSFENNSFSSTGNLTYLWDFSDGSTSTDGVPKHSYNVIQSSSFNVTLVVSVAGGCPALFTKSVNIEPSPVCGFTARDTFISPQGRGVYFKAADLTGTKYSWVLEGQGGNAAKEFFHQFSYFRPYDVSLNITNSAGCACLSNKSVNFKQTDVKTIAEIGVTVYPNPTNDKVQVDGNDITAINVYNVEGKLVYTANTVSANNIINSAAWAAGVYQIEIASARGNSVVKLIKY